MYKTVLLGGGGFAVELIEYLRSEYIAIAGYCDIDEKLEMKGLLEYLGHEEDVHRDEYVYVLASGRTDIRKRLIKWIVSRNALALNFKSRYAYVSNSAGLGQGYVITPNVTIMGNAYASPFLLANVGCSIAHDAKLGQNVVVDPGARISGMCRIGNNVEIGTNAVVLPGTDLADDMVIGTCSYVGGKIRETGMMIAPPSRWVRRER